MRQANFYAAVYAIIENEKGEILFQKRQNTGYRDGYYQVPSGHLEGKEDMKTGMIRELEEEIGIITTKKDLEVIHISHVSSPDDERVYFVVYIKVKSYKGTIKNKEPFKCEEITFIDLKTNTNKKISPNDEKCLQAIYAWLAFSDITESNKNL